MRCDLVIVFLSACALLNAKEKPLITVLVVDSKSSEKQWTTYLPGTPAKSNTNCVSTGAVYDDGAAVPIGTEMTNCTTTTTPATAPTAISNSIRQSHVYAILPDGKHVILGCQAGFRRCSDLQAGSYSAELTGNTVWMYVYDLDGKKKHKVKYRFEGGW